VPALTRDSAQTRDKQKLKMEKKRKQIRHFLATSKFRDLCPVEKGAHLTIENQCGSYLAAKVTGASKSAIHRAKKAIQNSRPVGFSGAPKTFTESEEQIFVEKVRTMLSNRDRVTYNEAKRIVSFTFIQYCI
jgi:hypothetical protein